MFDKEIYYKLWDVSGNLTPLGQAALDSFNQIFLGIQI
jgi:hypothetical protein